MTPASFANEKSQKALVAILCVVVALPPLVILWGNYDPANLPQTALVDVIVLTLVCFWLVCRNSGAGSLRLSGAFLPLAAFLAWSALSLSWAQDRHVGTVLWLHWGACALALLVASDVLGGGRGVPSVLRSLVAAGTLVALLGTVQYLFRVDWVPQAFPPAATFANKNVAAQFIVMVVPLALFLLLTTRRPREVWVYALVLPLLGAFLFYAQARSSWLGLCAEVAVALGWLRWTKTPLKTPQPRAAPLLFLTAVLLLLVHLGPSGFRMSLGEAYRHGVAAWTAVAERTREAAPTATAPASVVSVRARIAIWRNTLEMVRDFPVRGVGLGNHPVQYPRYARRAAVDPLFRPTLQLDFAHNDYLQVAAELGLVGLGLSVWLGVAVAGIALRGLRAAPAGEAAHLPLALVAALTGVLVDAFFSFPFRIAMPPLVCAVLVGILSASVTTAPSERLVKLPQALVRGSIPVALASVVAMAWFQYQRIRADRHCNAMFAASGRGDWDAARQAAEAALRANPRLWEPHFIVASASLASGQPALAAPALEAVLRIRPYDMATLGNLGLAYTALNDRARALDCYRRLLALKPDEAVANFRVAALLQSQGERSAALEAYRLAAQQDPTTRLYQYRLGLAALQTGSYAEAEAALLKAIALDPRSAPERKALGVLLFEMLARRQEGVEHLRLALTLDPKIADAEHIRQLVDGYDRELNRKAR